MSKPKLRRVILSLALVISVFSVGASSAHAWNLTEHSATWNTGNGQLSPPFGYGTNITGNMALNPGSGYITVCQYTADWTSNAIRQGCGTNGVGNALNLTPYYGHLLEPRVYHLAGAQHLVRQVMYTGTP